MSMRSPPLPPSGVEGHRAVRVTVWVRARVRARARVRGRPKLL